MIDLKPVLRSALSVLPAQVALAYARQELPLPVITLADESAAVSAQADGQPYLEEYVCSVQLYAASPAELETLTAQADAILTSLGLRKTHQQDLYDEQAYAWRKSLRYRCLLKGSTIYQ